MVQPRAGYKIEKVRRMNTGRGGKRKKEKVTSGRTYNTSSKLDGVPDEDRKKTRMKQKQRYIQKRVNVDNGSTVIVR